MTWDPVHHGRSAFRACLDAVCAPGTRVAIPAAGIGGGPVHDGAAAVLLALLDPGQTLAVAGGLTSGVAAVLSLSGAQPAAVGDADLVLVGHGAGPGIARRAHRGTLLTPEDGATIVYAGTWNPQPGVLVGPGLPGPTVGALCLPPGECEALADANRRPPTGVDAFVVDGLQVTALPRSVSFDRRVA